MSVFALHEKFIRTMRTSNALNTACVAPDLHQKLTFRCNSVPSFPPPSLPPFIHSFIHSFFLSRTPPPCVVVAASPLPPQEYYLTRHSTTVSHARCGMVCLTEPVNVWTHPLNIDGGRVHGGCRPQWCGIVGCEDGSYGAALEHAR